MTRFLNISLPALLGVALLAASAPMAHAQFATEIADGHYDLEAAYDGTTLSLLIGVDAPLPGEPDEYDPASTLYQLQSSANAATNDRFARPAGSAYDFFGVPAGSDIWLSAVGSNDESIAPLIGLAAENIATGVFVNDRISLRLVGFTGSGQFSCYLPTVGVPPTPSYTTANGISASDTADLITGAGHQDFVFAFTAPGLYRLTFEATGTLIGGGTRTATNTYNFGVNYINAPVVVPEAGTAPLLLGAGSLLFGGLVLRRRAR